MQQDYLSLVYNEKRTPKTDYPNQFASYLFEIFNMKKGQKFLEVGCGRGEFLNAFQMLGLNCYSVDKSNIATKEYPNLKIKNLDITKDKFPFDDYTFDIVYHKSLLEHLNSPENLMSETFRVLKNGGKIIILTPDWISQMKVFYEDFTHNKPYDVTSLKDLLEFYGFSEVKTKLFYQLPILWKYPAFKIMSYILRKTLNAPIARKLTIISGIKFFRWSVELMVLGTGIK